MILDWDGYRQELSKRIGDLGRLTPATVRGYRELSAAGNQTAHLDAKTRELVAIAVGVTRQCDGCITTHVEAARKHDLRTRLLVVQAAGRSVGLLVDACREFLTIAASSIQQPGDRLAGVGTHYISGIATLNDRLIVILNLGALLDSAEPILAA